MRLRKIGRKRRLFVRLLWLSVISDMESRIFAPMQHVTVVKTAGPKADVAVSPGIVNRVQVVRYELLSSLKNMKKQTTKAHRFVRNIFHAAVEELWSRMMKVFQNEALRMELNLDRVISTAANNGSARNMPVQQEVGTKLARAAGNKTFPLSENAMESWQYIKYLARAFEVAGWSVGWFASPLWLRPM